jgi:hypothetical protein
VGDYTPPDLGMPIEHVIDRHGYVWRLVRDGGMATRAHYAGLVSIGIATLEREAGPLAALPSPVLGAEDTGQAGGTS